MIVYLAGPYTHQDSEVRLARYEAITLVAARLIEKSCIVFSPLTMTHPIDIIMSEEAETQGSDFWVEFDEAFMSACGQIKVLKLPGWNESNGVKREIEHFKGRQIKPEFLALEDFGIDVSGPKYRKAFSV